jgi:hypothetical protein
MITLTLNRAEAYLAFRILIQGLKGSRQEARDGEELAAHSLGKKTAEMADKLLLENAIAQGII